MTSTFERDAPSGTESEGASARPDEALVAADAADAANATSARPRLGLRGGSAGALVLVGLAIAVVVVGAWHLTQGTSGIGPLDLLRLATGAKETVGGVPVEDVLTGSRLPRLLAGVAVGVALGVAGALLQSVTRNPLASPDTLAVTAGSYFAVSAVAAFGISIPLWASGAVAFIGGLLAAAVVLSIAGAGAATATTRLILAGSAMAMALDAASAVLLILFKESTTGLFAWGSGSLAQLNLDASLRAAPLIAVVVAVGILLARRLDLLTLGDDAAASLGVPVRSTRVIAVVGAVLLTSTSVTVAGPIAFVGLAAPVVARLLAGRIRSLHRHVLFLPVSGLLGALLILLADAVVRAILGAEGATVVPTGVPTALLGAVVIVLLALRIRAASAARTPPQAKLRARTRRRFVVILVGAAVLVVAAVVLGVLAGSLWLKLGDVALWLQGAAPDLIAHALDERVPRVLAALLAGAGLALAGTVVQSTVRNPLAEPGVLGISAGAGLGAVIVVTSLGGSRPLLVLFAVVIGVATFAAVALLSARGGLQPERFVLVGIGFGYGLSALTTFLLLRSDPWNTPRILTWLSGTTYGREFVDVLPIAVGLVVAVPLVVGLRRRLDLVAIDDDTPRLMGVQVGRTRLLLLTIAALLATLSVVAVGVVGFVGLVAPHLARALVGARHGRIIPVSLLFGALLVCIADTLGRTVIAPSQIPAGLVIALIGAPYFVWLLRRTRA
ncbi:iron ABC transporter permease [Schumannella soli]|uniref:Iron ABC transporter permease n=1 Tax=Schumannella soli TaxID=2590779 RepID=A0A506Y0P0_9MICO|nr:iron ABC transporter permease [Schumannella soli]TPW75057.1 iron ABC transporter permease [Schumannella soli]